MKIDVDKIIQESINKVLSEEIVTEKFDSSQIRDMYKASPSYKSYHRGNSFARKNIKYEIPKYDMLNNGNGLGPNWFLDKVTDDMIEATGDLKELGKRGYSFSYNKVLDSEGNKHYAIALYGNKYIIFNNKPETIQKMKELSALADKKFNDRQQNRKSDGKYNYQWSTKERGTAFHDWKSTAPLWDDEEFRKQRDVNVPKDWRNKETWLGQQMKNALGSYKNKDAEI